LAAEEAARKKEEEEARKKEEAKKAAEKQNKKKLSKKQRKRLAIAAAKEKEENERIEKEKKQKELEAAAAKKTSDGQAEGKKKKRKKKKKKAPVETAPVETVAVQEAVTKVVIEQPEEDDDGWEKVPARGKKRGKKTKSAPAQTEGNADLPKGPIVQEVLDLGTKPIDREATDEARQSIMSVLGFPPRPSKDGRDDQIPGRREAKWLRNVELFKTKLNVLMEFKETKSKYYLLMNGTPANCQDAIKAAQQLFDQGYSDILTPGMTQETMIVEAKARGAVVGKGAENIKQIQAEYSVNIQLPPRVGTSDVVTLSGPTEGVKMAKIAIKQLMETGISDCTHPDSSVRSVMVPNRRKWILIGTKGSNIRRIQDQYQCRITVPQNVEGQKPDDLVAVMVAGEKALLDAAVADIKESIAEPEPEQIPGFSKELTCEYDPWSED